MHEKFEKMNDAEKVAFTLGRESVLMDFDNMCLAHAFIGFSEIEWNAIKKFFAFNNAARQANNN